jgi:hypothetical protein
MRTYQEGYIFLMTLIITAVISILVLSSMQYILLYHKAINQQEVVHQNFYQLEDVVFDLVRAPLSLIEQHCISHKDSANHAIEKLIHHQGCLLRNGTIDYQYFIEDLGAFPCLVTYKKGIKHATYHRRVSVVQMDDGYPTSLLQVRFISITAALTCLAQEHVAPLGITSWRYFSSLDSTHFSSYNQDS